MKVDFVEMSPWCCALGIVSLFVQNGSLIFARINACFPGR